MVETLRLKLKEQKGFTLIELLAVIVILGIIAAIAIPAIGNVINNSKEKATAQEGVQIINAAKMYFANNESSVTWADGTVTGTKTTTLTKANIDEFLDHADASTYTVIITKSATGKLSYELSGGHPAIAIANTTSGATKASEEQLITKSK